MITIVNPILAIGDQVRISFAVYRKVQVLSENGNKLWIATVTEIATNPDGTKTITFDAPKEAEAYTIAQRLLGKQLVQP